MVIPLIFPYSANAILYGNPNKTKRLGIINCFRVDKPERMYEVIETGKVIFKILLLKVIFVIALLQYFILSLLYKNTIKQQEQISEMTSAKIRHIQIDSTV